MLKTKQENKGITLITLTVTIVVLLILSGISISSLIGNIGLLNKSTESKNKTKEAEEREKIGLAITTAQIGNNGYQELNKSNLQDAIDNQFEDESAIIIDDGNKSYIVRLNDKEYKISNSKNITKLKKVKDSTPRKFIWQWNRKCSLFN